MRHGCEADYIAHTGARTVRISAARYAWFIVATYRPYLDWHLRLQSPDLAGLPEDVIGYGFWMWWPVALLCFVFGLGLALSALHRRWRAALVLVVLFAVLSCADYWLCQRLVQELIRPAG
jgi:hypothetical protein